MKMLDGATQLEAARLAKMTDEEFAEEMYQKYSALKDAYLEVIRLDPSMERVLVLQKLVENLDEENK